MVSKVNIRKGNIPTFCFLTAFLLSLLPGGQAQAADDRLQDMVYEVYAGGIHAVQATLHMDLAQKDRYALMLTAKTRGFLGSLVPWHGSFESNGWNDGKGHFHPELHKSVATWRDETDIKEYFYTRAGGFQELWKTDPGEERKKEDTSPEVTDGTTDALTAALLVFDHVARGNPCEGESEVFDGKRRFRQTFKSEGEEELQPSEYNIFKGKAEKCTVEVTPVAGEWGKKPRGWLSIQEQGRERGTMPTVWLARLSQHSPAVPVKIMVKTAYGTLFMHLAEYRNADKIVVAEKRAEEE